MGLFRRCMCVRRKHKSASQVAFVDACQQLQRDFDTTVRSRWTFVLVLCYSTNSFIFEDIRSFPERACLEDVDRSLARQLTSLYLRFDDLYRNRTDLACLYIKAYTRNCRYTYVYSVRLMKLTRTGAKYLIFLLNI